MTSTEEAKRGATPRQQTARDTLPWVVVGIAIVTVVAGIAWTAVYETTQSADWSELGQRGDFWGGHLNAVMSFASALLFLAALLFQGKELALQRDELREAREVYAAQERQLRAQADAAQRQVEIAEEQAVLAEIFQLAQVRAALKGAHATAVGAMQSVEKPLPKEIASEVAKCTKALGTLIDQLPAGRKELLRGALTGL